ncbi:MAG: hypothetical protein HY050_03300 [Actinobacteria bacterium]|nr:hypothetical protein [Actinomycetota bacterium]
MRSVSSRFFINPVRNPFLWTFIAAHSFVAVFLGKIYAFAPDEMGYLTIYRATYERGFSTASILGWSNSQTLVLRTFYLPARGLEAIGIPDYLAIRFLALSLICTGFYFLTQQRERVAFPFLLIGNLILFETKSYLFLLVLLSSLVSIILLLIRRRRGIARYGYVVIALILPLVINPAGAKYLSDGIKGQLTSISATGGSSIATVTASNATAASENVATTASGLRSALTSQPQSLFSRTLRGLGMGGAAEPSPNSGSSQTPEPPSTYNTSRLNVSPARFGNPVTFLLRSAGFLFTPFPFIDNGSLFLNIAALESPFWWFLYVGFGVALWRRFGRKRVDELTIFLLSFTALFVLFSAFTEINVGTMARHRSVLVIPMLYLILATPKERYSN